MSMNFIKNIKEQNIDEKTHEKFVRYSVGDFEKEEFIIKKGASFVQVKAGFEYLSVILELMASLVKENVSLDGMIVTKENILSKIKEFGIEPEKVTGKKCIIKEEMSPERFKEFISKFNEYYLLFKLKSGKRSIAIKKSVPKPGKLVEGFVNAKFEKDDLKKIKDEFLFDLEVGDFKQASIKHTYVIEELIAPEGCSPEEARLNAKRKGKIIRKISIDGKEQENEIKLIA